MAIARMHHRHECKPRSHAGMALLELLVAVAIFAVVAAIAYRGIASVTTARMALQEQNDRLGKLQFAVAMIERDLRQALPRPGRGSYGEVIPAIAGRRDAIEFTAAAFASPFNERRPQLERVAYAAPRDALERFAQAVDRGTPAAPTPRALVPEIESLRFRYLGASDTWGDQWPPIGESTSGIATLPRAVEFTIGIADFGEVRRIVQLVEPVAIPQPPVPPT
jgi:general secretion pathway protein J